MGSPLVQRPPTQTSADELLIKPFFEALGRIQQAQRAADKCQEVFYRMQQVQNALDALQKALMSLNDLKDFKRYSPHTNWERVDGGMFDGQLALLNTIQTKMLKCRMIYEASGHDATFEPLGDVAAQLNIIGDDCLDIINEHAHRILGGYNE